MNITSPAFKNNTTIPKAYTCDGENVSPPLRFSDVPKNAKSLALIVDDPDALDTLLTLPEGVDTVAVEKRMQGHILASAYLVGLYKRT